jgi:hypothetical protein
LLEKLFQFISFLRNRKAHASSQPLEGLGLEHLLNPGVETGWSLEPGQKHRETLFQNKEKEIHKNLENPFQECWMLTDEEGF